VKSRSLGAIANASAETAPRQHVRLRRALAGLRIAHVDSSLTNHAAPSRPCFRARANAPSQSGPEPSNERWGRGSLRRWLSGGVGNGIMIGRDRRTALFPSRAFRARLRRRALAIAIFAGGTALAVAGCGDEFLAAPPVDECREVATQCRLAKGPLGVCERRACEDAESAPCFTCTPQH